MSLRKDGARQGPPFRRVLIANRGEIALRVIRACHDLGIETVAIHSDADADARHVRAADQAIRIGPPPASESYLRIDAVVEAAVASGSDAVHPGYGFLSERPAFAEACRDAGLTFVGPEPATLRGLGDKLHARRAAAGVGVPVVPGSLEPIPVERADGFDAIADAASQIGFPLLVKAAAGGGGRGMRVVLEPRDLPAAVAAAAHEAEAAFGDGAVYLERRIDAARHIEVQLLGDAAGSVVAIGERDCSVQRRHQKLVEEGPAPGLEPAARQRLHALATAVARAVGLRNAATAEFLVEPGGEAWFLEVNARLQVEHGVTELITGLDLVQEQLWLAAGWPLGADVLAVAADAAHPARHAIEVRLSAEDPGRGFAPTAGRLGRWRAPSGLGVRMDDWVEDGTVIGGDYDPLLGKLLVVDADRPRAIARMVRALDELEVSGLQTTLPFHRWLMADPAFRAAELAIDFVDRRWRPDAMRAAAAGVAADAAARHHAADAGHPGQVMPSPDGRMATPTGSRSPWRAAGRAEAVDRWPR
ncbi:MAG TPA: biotin carboxylase N-terminal domain-containing protein [Candidatus Limnocylindrales bacterium]